MMMRSRKRARLWLSVAAVLSFAGMALGAPVDAELRRRAEQGEPDAQYRMGVAHSKGEGAVRDDVEAAGWFIRAAEGGHPEAQFILGLLYSSGLGVPQDDVMALMWLRVSAAWSAGEDRALAMSLADGISIRMSPAQIEEAERRAVRCLPPADT